MLQAVRKREKKVSSFVLKPNTAHNEEKVPSEGFNVFMAKLINVESHPMGELHKWLGMAL